MWAPPSYIIKRTKRLSSLVVGASLQAGHASVRQFKFAEMRRAQSSASLDLDLEVDELDEQEIDEVQQQPPPPPPQPQAVVHRPQRRHVLQRSGLGPLGGSGNVERPAGQLAQMRLQESVRRHATLEKAKANAWGLYNA